MSLPPLRSAVFPAHSPTCDIVIASIFLVAMTASLVSAKTMAFTCAFFVAVLLATHAARGAFSITFVKHSSAIWPLIGLMLLSWASLLWAAEPIRAVGTLAVVSLTGFAVVLAVRTIVADTFSGNARLAESLWIGLLVGLIYLIMRNITNGETDSLLLPAAAQNVITIDAGEMTRSIAPVTLLIGPALLAISAGFNKPWSTIFSVVIIAAGVVAIATSPHETSKLALAIWAVVFVLTWLSERMVYRSLQAAWLSACLLVVPVAIVAKAHYELQNASWLQLTAQQRILIWNEYAMRTLDTPVLGHGFDMSGVISPTILGLSELSYVQTRKQIQSDTTPFRALHPHNAYLQVWFELGAVGAALLLAAGLAVLSLLARLPMHQRPYLYATSAAAAVMLLSSYGFWQIWFIGMLGFTTIASAIAIRVSSTQPHPVHDRTMSSPP